jgi:hypothetical protein
LDEKALSKLNAIVAALTSEELDLIRRRYRPEHLVEQLRDIGVDLESRLDRRGGPDADCASTKKSGSGN